MPPKTVSMGTHLKEIVCVVVILAQNLLFDDALEAVGIIARRQDLSAVPQFWRYRREGVMGADSNRWENVRFFVAHCCLNDGMVASVVHA